jgi:glycosyltransferase involved in cell wall biosynthesis
MKLVQGLKTDLGIAGVEPFVGDLGTSSRPILAIVPTDPNAGRASSIGIVLHDFSLGGTERIAVRLANEWAASGRNVTIVCGTEDGPLRPLISPRVKLVALNPVIDRGFGSRRKLGRAAAAVFARDVVDLVFIPGNFHWQVVPELARLPVAVRPRIAAQLSTPLFRYDRGRLHQQVYNRWMRWQLRHADAAISLEDTMTVQANTILRNRITRRIRTPALDRMPMPSQPSGAGNRTIVAAGRLTAVKGFANAISAFALLDEPDATLIILGEGPLRTSLLRQAERLGVADRVEFPGYVACIRPWLDKAAMFLLSSRYEGYPAVLVEAIAAGRPVVATRCSPAIDELVEQTGFGASVPIDDPQALADAMAMVFAAAPPCPVQMAAAVAPFGIENCARDYLGMFDTLCTA